MAMLNSAGRAFARALIDAGQIDRSEQWSFSADDSAALAEHDAEHLDRYHLGVEEERHLYPFTKLDQDGELRLHRSALVSISTRAAQRGEDDIHDAAEALLRAIEETDQEGAGADADSASSDGDGGTSGGGKGDGTPPPSDGGGDGSGSASMDLRKAKERALLEKLRGTEHEAYYGRARLEPGLGERALDPSKIDRDARTIDWPVSSEAEIERWFGIEILDHSPGAVRLDRMRANGPLMSEHWGPQIGASLRVWLDERARQLRSVCKFGRSMRAEEEWQDVLDEIRTGVSIRYLIHSLRLEEERDGVEVYRITDWEPTHIALVAEPADISVGAGRSRAGQRHKAKEGQTMKKDLQDGSQDTAAIRAEIEKDLLERSKEIRAVCGRFRGRVEGIDALEEKALNEGWDLERVNAAVVDMLGDRSNQASKPVKPDPRAATIGLSDREAERWSWMRAIRALIAMETGGGKNDPDIRDAGFEFEVSRAIADKLKVEHVRGILVPFERSLAQRRRETGQRAVNKGTAAQGGNLVATELLSGSMIDALDAASPVLGMSTIWDGLVGDINFPKTTTLPTAYHVATEGNNLTGEGVPGVGIVQGTPRELGVYTNITRKMLKQSSIGIDNWVEDRQNVALALKMEQMALSGSGLSGEPTGVINAAGVSAVDAPTGANAAERAAKLFKAMVNLKSAVRIQNAEKGRVAYVTNADVQGLLEATEKSAGNGQYIWVDGELGGRVAGRPAYATTLCPNNLGVSTDESAIIYGNWAELYLLLWGVRDLTLDRASLSLSGGLRIVSFQDYDIQLAHAESFAVIDNLDVDNDY